ncbi:mechanosensitive ion channel family protein [Candidatus Saccharibacteria bacterium]|nr:mechanosensitive ion channel family protein [Candidatus Saccharibacteria bacterium]
MGIKKASKVFSNKKRKTYLRMLRSIIAAVILIIIVLVVLQLLGVNVSSMLAGVGIASIVIGFALQDAMKDIFRGLEIVSDNYYDIGDVIKYNDNVGQVLSINLRTTKIQDINTMNVVSIANRNIDHVEVLTGYIYLPVPFPLRIKPSAADSIMLEIAKEIQTLPNATSVVNQGVSNITNSSLNYQLQITCDPTNQLQTRRDCLGVVVNTFANHKILLPYTQLDIHQKK